MPYVLPGTKVAEKHDHAFQGRISHYFVNPPSVFTCRNAVFGYRPLPRHVRDERAKGTLYRPSPTAEDKIAGWEEPIFDRGGEAQAPIWGEMRGGRGGSHCLATWQFARVGNVSAAVTGRARTHAELERAVQPTDAEGKPRPVWDPAYNYKCDDEPEIKAEKHAGRIRAERRRRADLRSHGKMHGKPDLPGGNWAFHFREAGTPNGPMLAGPTVYPRPARVFRLFKRDERNFWRRGCNEWLPHQLISAEAEGRNAHIKRPLRKPPTVLIRSIGLSLNELMTADSKTTWQDLIVDDTIFDVVGLDGLTDGRRMEMVETIDRALACLGPRDRSIFLERFRDGRQIKDIAADFRVSESHVYDISNHALAKMRAAANGAEA
jgi:hypothetical protein